MTKQQDKGALTKERMVRLVRIYRTGADAAKAVNMSAGSINRAARRYGLKFRGEKN